jgi:hypothetical protein
MIWCTLVTLGTDMTAAHKPTPELQQKVKELSRAGYSHDSIGKYLGISDETLRKYYVGYLDRGRFDLVATALNNIAKKVDEGDIKMSCWVAVHLGEIAPYKPPETKNQQLAQAVLEKLMDKL